MIFEFAYLEKKLTFKPSPVQFVIVEHEGITSNEAFKKMLSKQGRNYRTATPSIAKGPTGDV